MTVLLSLFTVLALGGPGKGSAAKAAPTDSIGVEMRGGQRFVKHRVTAGETLTALTRRYHVSLDQLTAANPQIKNGLGIGQIVYVPRPAAGKTAAATTASKATAPAAVVVPARHTVAKGETLFGIARKYQLTPDELIRLNKLPAGGAVRVGQQLVLSGSSATAEPAAAPVRAAEVEAVPTTTVAKTPPPAPDKPAQIATVTSTAPAEKEKEEKREEREEKTERTPTRAGELLSRVVENGLGASIENNVTDKYLALHKTAPVGTIMQVKNSMNGLSVYVRVIGKLPDTGENNNILVRLSPRAVQKLGTSDARFRVETNYIPQ
ncbi:DPBB and LysM peptidoglycan-binding domain-containing protein [Hymenobacter properus]|uniref:LysM peptidoglycan-binding domain-containing protein n=1 Tax=Hymenobacter properus TaxID=2791026 RepID=A0A931BEV5_9BACT|nr:LysM peptidoglycan-binding domain-containing protein [Hymenobacter properus]MBF9141002.1 LysM peptidoglycan-binding domain-containing protein [Hymenobacter properus]MBR7719811.1 LysM peptidoglycan-binding domain-containing protein [Microvirga sp. SRT04]